MYRSLGKALPTLGGCIGLLLATAAVAAPEPEKGTRFEVTPYVGQLTGGEFEDPADGSDRDVDGDVDFKLFLNINAGSPERQYEILYANQGTEVKGAVPIDMSIQYLHFGGIVNFTDVQPVVPYFGMTIGATQFSPDASGLDDETKFSASVGAGLKYKFTKNIGLRFDVRAFVTLLDADGDLFCVSGPEGAGCAIAASGDTFIQYGAGLGLIAAF
ncbi:MAG TPA: outer membrane beta-barrel protein [Povalibacter sp.]|uniref:outer membrane beta-barrel protein n=1 Tax=Povalibacter sp. TaxID=1962978 RepID=UPI002C61C3D2|nr:outer membrane beta-barrel protein [Povalibacter sp.]HMN44900.1 outer membrane beta-barrel protein [Povalibacter sp.]